MLDFGDITETARNGKTRKDGLIMVLAEKPIHTDAGTYKIRLCWNPETDASAIYVWDTRTGEPVTNLRSNDRERTAYVFTHPVVALGLA